MEYIYKINKQEKAIIVIIVGELNASDFAKLDLEICKLAIELNYNIIFNFSKAIVNIGIGEAYFWFKNHLDKINVLFREIPIAHIASEVNENFLYFVETTWSNNGIKTKMFKEEQVAMKWLQQFN